MERGEGSIKERMNLLAQDAEKRKRLMQLRHETLRKAEFLRSKAIIDPHEVYQLIKSFFQQFLEQHREFTIAELRAELKKVYISNGTREALGLVLDQMHALEYRDVHYAHADLARTLDAFTEIVKQLIRTHAAKRSLLARLRAFFFKEETEPAVIIAELPVLESDDPCRVRILTLVEKCYIALDRHSLNRAKAAYKALLGEYDTLDRSRKEEYYPLIEQTYQDILNRAAQWR